MNQAALSTVKTALKMHRIGVRGTGATRLLASLCDGGALPRYRRCGTPNSNSESVPLDCSEGRKTKAAIHTNQLHRKAKRRCRCENLDLPLELLFAAVFSACLRYSILLARLSRARRSGNVGVRQFCHISNRI